MGSPTNVIPTKVIPTNVIPTNVIPTDVIPSDVIATDMIATNVIATDVIPTDVIHTNVIPTITVSTSMVSTNAIHLLQSFTTMIFFDFDLWNSKYFQFPQISQNADLPCHQNLLYVGPLCIWCRLLKVSKFQNELMMSSFSTKYKSNIIRIFAL